MTSLQLTDTVGALVRDYPSLAALFETAEIDYCCGGQQTLAEACAQRGIDAQTFLKELEAAIETAPEPAIADLSLTALVDHIETVHHAYLQRELPRLEAQAEKVAAVHGSRDARLQQLHATVVALAAELKTHLQKEEQVLFPRLRQLEKSYDQAVNVLIPAAIDCMQREHAETGVALTQLRRLSDGFTPPEWACNTYRVLLAGLLSLEKDLHQHIHKENNLLFPKAIALLEAKRLACAS
ncbi:iron-sulfur cluster repair di-iron protein [Thermosynechococcus sp. GLH187]|uniref:iron-sulfur cluster repair di-iron protein n=1 Tax=unclassified Thermosynechococcus TaxID=2622553 RepID=UPI002872E458|nr:MULTISPECIES: iron-sulfur cluster repair di-iron protein [unclassified Thermosynechococcus]WNC22819.1 iron-sulfur cluster repair di-iron protein [Thermosynechococcus sp. PP22]WNC45672.1 iron-sulfur cluster repair di-iron protein [Thermosynechococcus sp. GLH187]WNC48208.1 iron-sulfur cluster repair di-iron protein [Thermosynechococcus sp. GLH333]WNC50741.1 iron-sulfur cluster repair di-iron protein [Thermosynechococcus sp. GLH87]WNC53287.1 iron-sulfur cluster repair di-iron protein [Thermosy